MLRGLRASELGAADVDQCLARLEWNYLRARLAMARLAASMAVGAVRRQCPSRRSLAGHDGFYVGKVAIDDTAR